MGWVAQTPLLPFLGEQPIPPADWVPTPKRHHPDSNTRKLRRFEDEGFKVHLISSVKDFAGSLLHVPRRQVLPFCVDLTVGVTAPFLASAVASSPSPRLWGLLTAWVAYGWLDHVFAAVATNFKVGSHERWLKAP